MGQGEILSSRGSDHARSLGGCPAIVRSSGAYSSLFLLTAVCAEDHQLSLPSPPSFFIPGALAAASWPSSILCCSIKSLPENKGPALLYQAAGASGKQGRQPLISCHGLFLSTLISCPGLHPVQNVAGIRRRAPKAAWIATLQTLNSSCCKVYAHKPQGKSHLPVWSDLTCLEGSPPTVDRAREGQTLAARSDSRLSPARTEKEKNK